MAPQTRSFLLPVVSFTGLLIASAIATLLAVLPVGARAVPIVAVVWACASRGRARDAAWLGPLGWAFFDGFVLNAYGVLTLTPASIAFLACFVAGTALIGAARTRRTRPRPAPRPLPGAGR